VRPVRREGSRGVAEGALPLARDRGADEGAPERLLDGPGDGEAGDGECELGVVREGAGGAGDGEVEGPTRGALPYTLRWHFRVTESDFPHRFALEAWGDFRGRGEWRLRQDGPVVDVTYDWRVRAEKPLLRRLTWLLRPAFAANHRWAMRQGEASLRRELARRAAAPRSPPSLA
jgi:hypothetical protein